MRSFRGGFLDRFSMPLSSVWLLTDIAEAKGRQAVSTRQPPQVLTALRESALVQSVESSNRIEGVTNLERACPGVSRDLVRRDLQGEGKVECVGRGPGARWRRRRR
jgi:hypothetical protein